MDVQIEEFLPLAAKIAREFSNIPVDSEIGASLGISKQAVHQMAGAAISSLKETLESMGFRGIDTHGLLKSCRYTDESATGPLDDFPPRP